MGSGPAAIEASGVLSNVVGTQDTACDNQKIATPRSKRKLVDEDSATKKQQPAKQAKAATATEGTAGMSAFEEKLAKTEAELQESKEREQALHEELRILKERNAVLEAAAIKAEPLESAPTSKAIHDESGLTPSTPTSKVEPLESTAKEVDHCELRQGLNSIAACDGESSDVSSKE